jgi:hypothetical protein
MLGSGTEVFSLGEGSPLRVPSVGLVAKHNVAIHMNGQRR